MQRKATTVRLEPASQAGLNKLSEILRQPVNKLVNEAVREYVVRRSKQAEDELASTLEDLRALRKRDPNFEESIAKFIEAELAVTDDPATLEPLAGGVLDPSVVEALRVAAAR